MKTTLRCSLWLAVSAALLPLIASADDDTSYAIELEAQPMSEALKSLADQTGLQVVFFTEVTDGVETVALNGEYTADTALDSLLDESGLTYEYINDNAVTVRSVAAVESEATKPGKFQPASSPVLMAQNQRSAQQNQRATGSQTTGNDDGGQVPASNIEEIVVVGTNIRGAAPVGSPVFVFDREEIANSGVATVQEFLETVPQNFGGDAAQDISGTNDGVANTSRGAGINLRGLGTTSTLTLVNGRRLTQSGGFSGSFVDVSGLPLSAIERVEILTDGASAIYGSDAIAGVVNIVLRNDYEGIETVLRAGDAAEGGGAEILFGQTFGKSWGSGNALLSFEYYDKENVGAEERSFTASDDLRPLGGDDFRRMPGNPGTIVVPTLAGLPEGQDGTGLTASDLILGQRNFGNANEGRDLLADQERKNVLLMLRQEVGISGEVFAELRYGARDYETRNGGAISTNLRVPSANPNYVSPDPDTGEVRVDYNFIDDFGPTINSGEVTTYNAAIGTRFDVGENWQAEVYGAYNSEETTFFFKSIADARLGEALGIDDPATSFDPLIDGFFNVFADGSNTPQNVLDYVFSRERTAPVTGDLVTVNAKADGSLFELPGGMVRLAIGGEYREESFERSLVDTVGGVPGTGSAVANEEREVTATFAELLLPFVTEANSRPGFERLELSAAVRYEDYSDFGSTTEPKLGISWSPVKSLTIRGTYGTSFKAPKQVDLISTGQTRIAFNFPDPTGSALALWLIGSNPDLQPETSESWTVGLDIEPVSIPGLSIELTYYDIRFKNRTSSDIPGQTFAVLFDPDLFAPILTFEPDDALVQSIIDEPGFLNFAGPFVASDVEVIVDRRLKNLGVTEVNGLDFFAKYRVETASGDFDFSLNGSYISNFDESLVITAPLSNFLNTINNPVDLRLRGSASWSRNGWGLSTFVNYTDGYTDDVSVPTRAISSWTTLDFSIRYDTGDRSEWLKNTNFSLSIQNAFDEDPPFANNFEGIGYDPENANPLGRFSSFTITKQW